MKPVLHPFPLARPTVIALSLTALSGTALAHPGHEHTLPALFDLMHVSGALALLALCAAGIALTRRRQAERRAERRTHNAE